MDTTSLTRRELHVVFLVALTFPVLFFLAGFYAYSLLNGALINGALINEEVVTAKSSKVKENLSTIRVADAANDNNIQLDSPPTLIETQISGTEQIDSAKRSPSSFNAKLKKSQVQQKVSITKPAVAKKEPRYNVQIALFSSKKRANSWRKSVASKNIETKIVTRQNTEKGIVYPIIIGTYASKQEAKNAAAEFTHKNKMSAYVTKANSIGSV